MSEPQPSQVGEKLPDSAYTLALIRRLCAERGVNLEALIADLDVIRTQADKYGKDGESLGPDYALRYRAVLAFLDLLQIPYLARKSASHEGAKGYLNLDDLMRQRQAAKLPSA